MKPSRKLEKAHTTLALEHCNVGLQLDKANARIAELTAEVARYKAAMQSIVDDYKQAFHTDWTTAANYADTARNALKGVV